MVGPEKGAPYTLFPAFAWFLESTTDRARQKKVPVDFMPIQSDKAWCHNCELSHEANSSSSAFFTPPQNYFVFSPEEGNSRAKNWPKPFESSTLTTD